MAARVGVTGLSVVGVESERDAVLRVLSSGETYATFCFLDHSRTAIAEWLWIDSKFSTCTV